jgi:Tol biopolymer transport system component
MAWAPDGGFLYWSGGANSNLWLLPLNGSAPAAPLLSSGAGGSHPQVSPDGKWVIYHSTVTGRGEVHVAPVARGDGRSATATQVSTNGGTLARWRADGKELFYLSAFSDGDVMAVTVSDSGSTLELGTPERLFASGFVNVPHPGMYHMFAVSPDGQRFLIPRPVASVRGEGRSAPITVVLSWTALLARDR